MSSKPKLGGCVTDESYCAFGVDRLSKLLCAFEEQIGGIIQSDDIEYVHKMRVASRRIRATMPLFKSCFPKKKYKKWLKQVKQVTGLLGEARDLDVQAEFIKKYQETQRAKASDLSIGLLLEDIKVQRERIQPSVITGLQTLKESAIIDQMRQFYTTKKEEYATLTFETDAVKDKAYWAISSRIHDFVCMEEYVQQENQSSKHHKMRIQAKWLRYTMESFSSLYPDKLKTDIQNIKNFQDALGEMHDCDVWIERTPKFADSLKKSQVREGKEGELVELSDFLDYVKKQRKKHYSEFVRLWDSSKESGFFEGLHKKTSQGSFSVEDFVRALEEKPQAKVAVFSDVHGNLQALKAVIDDAKQRGINIFLNAGDSIGYGAYPNEAIKLLYAKKVLSIAGNFDLEVLRNKKQKGDKGIAAEFANRQLEGACKNYLLSLPRELEFGVLGTRVLVTHGSPQSIDEHLYPNTPKEQLKAIAQATSADLIVTGHSHLQHLREVDGKVFLNPGSVGRPYDGNPKAAYAVVGFDPFSVELLRVSYDVDAAAEALRRKGLPERFSQLFLQGVSVDAIAKQDRLRKKAMHNTCEGVAENCALVAKSYCLDVKHFEQVRSISLRLFDELNSLHGLGGLERCWLECAAILHDIGISKALKGHNKWSMNLILNDRRLLLSSTHRRIVASIARYHRKALPHKNNFNLRSLKGKTVEKIWVLSGILRVADSLDYSHAGIVEDVCVKVEDSRIVVEALSCDESYLEQQAFIKKKNLMEKALKKKVVLTWRQP